MITASWCLNWLRVLKYVALTLNDVALICSDEKYDQSYKDSFRKKLSKWEKRTAQKFSGDR